MIEQKCRYAQTETTAPKYCCRRAAEKQISETRDYGENRMGPGSQQPPGLCTCPRLQRLPQHYQPAFAAVPVSACWSGLQLLPGLLALPAWPSNASFTGNLLYMFPDLCVLFWPSQPTLLHSAGVASPACVHIINSHTINRLFQGSWHPCLEAQ